MSADGMSHHHGFAALRPKAGEQRRPSSTGLATGAVHAEGACPPLPFEIMQDALDHLPGAMLFVKDMRLRYVACNGPMAEFCGAAHRFEMLGRTARDFFVDATWRQEEELEGRVLRTGMPLKNRLELTVRLHRPPAWSVFSYWPLFDSSSPHAVRVIGVGRVLARPDKRHATYRAIARAVDELHCGFHESINVASLARRCGLSARQLDANFVEVFGVPPRRYLTKVRLAAAVDLLGQGASIASIAHSCGYADQSAFTRRFRAAVGMSPSQYRGLIMKSPTESTASQHERAVQSGR